MDELQNVRADKTRKASQAKWKQKQRITETTSNTHRIGHIPSNIPAQNYHDVQKNTTLSTFIEEQESEEIDGSR